MLEFDCSSTGVSQESRVGVKLGSHWRALCDIAPYLLGSSQKVHDYLQRKKKLVKSILKSVEVLKLQFIQ